MALSACGLTGAARLAYDWLRRTQRAGRLVAEADHRRTR